MDAKGGWREQLETDVAPLLAADNPVWLRADPACYDSALAADCRERGWDYFYPPQRSGEEKAYMVARQKYEGKQGLAYSSDREHRSD